MCVSDFYIEPIEKNVVWFVFASLDMSRRTIPLLVSWNFERISVSIFVRWTYSKCSIQDLFTLTQSDHNSHYTTVVFMHFPVSFLHVAVHFEFIRLFRQTFSTRNCFFLLIVYLSRHVPENYMLTASRLTDSDRRWIRLFLFIPFYTRSPYRT